MEKEQKFSNFLKLLHDREVDPRHGYEDTARADVLTRTKKVGEKRVRDKKKEEQFELDRIKLVQMFVDQNPKFRDEFQTYLQKWKPTVGTGLSAQDVKSGSFKYVADTIGKNKAVGVFLGEVPFPKEDNDKVVTNIAKQNEKKLESHFKDWANFPDEIKDTFRDIEYNNGLATRFKISQSIKDLPANKIPWDTVGDYIDKTQKILKQKIPNRTKEWVEEFLKKEPPVPNEVINPKAFSKPIAQQKLQPQLADMPAGVQQMIKQGFTPDLGPVNQQTIQQIQEFQNLPGPINQETIQQINNPQVQQQIQALNQMAPMSIENPSRVLADTGEEEFIRQLKAQSQQPQSQEELEFIQRLKSPTNPSQVPGFIAPPTPQQPTLEQELVGIQPPPNITELGQAALEGLQRLAAPGARLAEEFPIAFKFSPLAQISHAISQIPQLQPRAGFKSNEALEELVSFSVSEAPLVLFPWKRLPGTSAGVSRALGFTEDRVSRNFLFRSLDRAVKGGVSFGAPATAAEGLRQFQEDEFDPERITMTALISSGLGASGNVAFGPLIDKMKNAWKARRAQKIARFEKQFEGDFQRSQVVSKADIIAAKQLSTELTEIENDILRNVQIMRNEAMPKAMRENARLKAIEAQRKHALKQVAMHDTLQGPAFKNLKRVKEDFADRTIKVNGKDVPVFDASMSPRGVLVSPEEINTLMGTSDIGKLQASAFGFQDVIRLSNQMDGQLRGPIRKMIVEPIEVANRIRQQQTARWKQDLRQKIDQWGINLGEERQKALFRAAEGRKLPKGAAPLTENERAFINYTKQRYSDMLDSINRTNKLLGLPPVKKRTDYITHLQKLSFADQFGLKNLDDLAEITTIKRKGIKFRFEKERIGADIKENLVDALDAYIDPAMRKIHMSKRAAEVQARVQFLPKNARKAFENWLHSAAMGGLDPKDAALLNAGLGPILRAAGGLSGLITRGVIGGSLNVTVQQPSQVLSTAMMSGVRNTIRGLGHGWKSPPPELMKASNFLTGRTIRDELIPVNNNTLKTFDKWLGAVIEHSDRYVARSSWYAGFEKAKNLGLSDKASVRYADDVARMLHASYQEILKPALLRGKTGRAAFSFQSFAFNLWNMVAKDPKVLAELSDTGRIRETLKLTAALATTNYLYEQMGLAAPFALRFPSEASMEGLRQAGTEALGMVPLVSGIQFGSIPSPVGAAVAEEAKEVIWPEETNQSFFGNLSIALMSEDEDLAKKAWSRVGNSISKVVPGGNQIKNTVRGFQAVRDGYYDVGNETVFLRDIDKIWAPLFGPSKLVPVQQERRRQKIEKIKKRRGAED